MNSKRTSINPYRSGMSAPTGPLVGVRVLDLTSVVMGPFATQMFGDLGADVISVEPAGGDVMRHVMDGPHPELGGSVLNLWRNKRNISLDLKRPEAQEIFLRLAATSDVMVTNLRPGPLARLGLDEASVRRVRPDIIYCQANGYPSDSARANDPAYDDVIQSESGLADAEAKCTGQPMISATILVDKLCGLTVTYAVLAALFHRERTGEGQKIEIPMLDASRAFMLVEHIGPAASVPPCGEAGYSRVLNPHRGPKQTADGWAAVLPYSAENWKQILTFIGRSDLCGDPRLATPRSRVDHAGFLYGALAEGLRLRSTAEVLAFCDRASIPSGPVSTLAEIVDGFPEAHHPVIGSYKVIPSATRFSVTPTSVHRPAPRVGEDTAEILRSLGFRADEIHDLARSGAVHLAD